MPSYTIGSSLRPLSRKGLVLNDNWALLEISLQSRRSGFPETEKAALNILIKILEGKLFFHVKLDDRSEVSGFAPEGLGKVLGAIRHAVLRRMLDRHFNDAYERYVRSLGDRRILINHEGAKLSATVGSVEDAFQTSSLAKLADFIDPPSGNPTPSDTSRSPSRS